jgi:hypothetical protein
MSSLVAKYAREAFNKMSVGPTPYMDTKGRRIRISGRGAIFTENSNNGRNYDPIAAFIKPLSGNGVRMNINDKNVKTVPRKIRPNTKFLNLNNSNSNSNSNNRLTVHCRACNKTYNGNAQCCFEMDHVKVKISPSTK